MARNGNKWIGTMTMLREQGLGRGYWRTLAAVLWLVAQGIAQAEDPSLPVAHRLASQLRARIEAGEAALGTATGQGLRLPAMLVRFYQQRDFEPAWVSDAGPLPSVQGLVAILRAADRHGLRPEAYHRAPIAAALSAAERALRSDPDSALQHLLDLELLLTDAALLYGLHVRQGQVDPVKMGEVWLAGQTTSLEDIVHVLQAALDGGRPEDIWQQLQPRHPGYARLLDALAHYRAIAARGGWPLIPDGPKLQRGDRGARVIALRRRLQASGDFRGGIPADAALFDTALEGALQRFQRRHGLTADGVLGSETLTALNVPVEARIRQIELNLERWRWLPQPLGERAIVVNIPDYTLQVVERGKPVLTMRVVVGQSTRRTPLLIGDLTYLVLNPHWYVPPSIAVQDKLPMIRKDPSYVVRQRFKIFRSGGGSVPLDPRAIDWSSVTAQNFPYRLRQDPGPHNALGRIKFMFPNPYHVYLHDTPSRGLFAKGERAFSSGCIRLEKPLELAEYLLGDDPMWSRHKLLSVIAAQKEQTVWLSKPTPVYLWYWTAWVNDEGGVEFRKDIYNRDAMLEKRLHDRAFSPEENPELYAAVDRQP
jgi:murein L,D-transpeptidase YcbB/YkuD